jgi:hypothetical protein
VKKTRAVVSGMAIWVGAKRRRRMGGARCICALPPLSSRLVSGFRRRPLPPSCAAAFFIGKSNSRRRLLVVTGARCPLTKPAVTAVELQATTERPSPTAAERGAQPGGIYASLPGAGAARASRLPAPGGRPGSGWRPGSKRFRLLPAAALVLYIKPLQNSCPVTARAESWWLVAASGFLETIKGGINLNSNSSQQVSAARTSPPPRDLDVVKTKAVINRGARSSVDVRQKTRNERRAC